MAVSPIPSTFHQRIRPWVPAPQDRRPALSDPDGFWEAVEARDRRFDGLFVFAVRSTGIYCRPSCPSRRPRRDRVVFYDRPAAAERSGFRACRRCEPRMFEDAADKRRLEAELVIAAEVQGRLLPATAPAVEGWEMHGVSRQCREVGGDYYDFVHDHGGLVIALGDVSGKGIGAALLMSSLHAAVRAQSGTGRPPAVVLGELNRYLYESTSASRYATLFYARLDPRTGEMAVGNAGHNPALVIRRSGECLRLEAGGPPLGLLADAAYTDETMRLAPGDVLVVFSDGMTEAMGPGGEEYGAERLRALAHAHRGASAADLSERIQEALARFTDGASASDDRSLVIVSRRSDS